jgi:hypothetical protein
MSSVERQGCSATAALVAAVTGREYNPVGGFEVKARNLAAKDREVMSQHENLDPVGPVAS